LNQHLRRSRMISPIRRWEFISCEDRLQGAGHVARVTTSESSSNILMIKRDRPFVFWRSELTKRFI